MEKWADFLISAVRYENNMITYLKVHPDRGSDIGGGSTWTKNEVLKAMMEGRSFFTIFRDENGSWKKGRSVHFLKENNKFIITDKKDVLTDSLLDLKEL